MATRYKIITTDTRQYISPQDASDNPRARQMRAEDLSAYGRSGYQLLSTIVVQQDDGSTIIDTLSRED